MARAYLRPAIRWMIEHPFADESIESVFERAHHAYKGVALAREGWLVEMCCDLGMRSGTLTSRAVVRIAQALGVRPTDLHRTILPDAPQLLSPAHRRAYCRACWVEDDRAGHPRYFRRAWAGALVFHCVTHNEPLRAGPRPAQPLADVPLSWDRPVYAAKELQVLTLVNDSADQLGRSLFNGAPWPRSWRLDPLRARNLLGRCVSNLLLHPSPCPAQWVWLSDSKESSVCEYRFERVGSTRGSVWEAYRQLGSPAARRAAVWLTAWIVVPKLSVNLRPTNVAEHVIGQQTTGIAADRRRAVGRHMRRLRNALELEATAWIG